MNEITRFEIDMLDIGAADAFLIHAFRKSDNGGEWEYIVLVDAGNECDGKKIKEHIDKYYTQKYIDLAICSHCDSDHYGGFKYLIENDVDIKKFWIHDPYQHVDVDDVKYVQKDGTLRDRLNAAYAFKDGTSLLDLLDDYSIDREEVFTGDTYNPLNIEVLGPDLDYYESLIPDFRVDLEFKEEPDDDYEDTRYFSEQRKNELYSQALEDANDDPSSVNQSSIIFSFKAKGIVYIFTGDAGKEALHRVVDYDYENEYKSVRWLKVPHHGSKHNLDNEIISHFKPQSSYISTERYGKYANRCTVNALKQVGNVYSTHHQGTMCHQQNMGARPGYSTAKPL